MPSGFAPVLFIGGDAQVHALVEVTLKSRGFAPPMAASWADSISRIKRERPWLIVAYLESFADLPAARRVIDSADGAAVLLLGEQELAPELERFEADGTARFLTRPLAAAALCNEIEQALSSSGQELAEALGLTGRSESFRRVLEQIRLVADKDASVLIMGETGVGKERVARAMHALSNRAAGELVTVNCAGIPATLLEDEFFGHERGAFTDAHRARPGRFEQASGGTIFLDEIGDLPLELQPKLLRVLQEREVHRLGGLEPIGVDARVIAATNVDLSEAVRQGRFRQDLFYRINVFPIHVPALRERREDIPIFIERFLASYCEREGLPAKTVDGRGEAALMARTWPGNIRELENAVEIAAIRSRERDLLTIEDFPNATAPEPGFGLDPRPDSPVSLRNAVLKFEHALIRRALEQVGGNKTQAAEALGMKRTTLVEKLRKLERELSAG